MVKSVVVVLVSLRFVSAQVPVAAPERPPQDPKALELIDKADARSYSAKRAGLKDLQYTHELSHLPGLRIEVRWAAPDAQKVVVGTAGGDSVPEHVRRIAEETRSVLESTGAQVLDMMIGKENRATYQGDEIILTGPNQVRVVARAEKSKKLFQENLITFDARGLPIQMKSRTKTGTVEMDVVHEAHGDLFRVKEVTSPSADGPIRMTIDYLDAGGFSFPTKITTKGPSMDRFQTFSGFRVNQGLKAEDLQ